MAIFRHFLGRDIQTGCHLIKTEDIMTVVMEERKTFVGYCKVLSAALKIRQILNLDSKHGPKSTSLLQGAAGAMRVRSGSSERTGDFLFAAYGKK